MRYPANGTIFAPRPVWVSVSGVVLSVSVDSACAISVGLRLEIWREDFSAGQYGRSALVVGGSLGNSHRCSLLPRNRGQLTIRQLATPDMPDLAYVRGRLRHDPLQNLPEHERA